MRSNWKRTGVAPDGFAIVPADGQWSWVVLFGAYVCGVVLLCPIATFGVIMNDLKTVFQVNTVTVTWAMALLHAFSGILAPISSVVCTTFSARKCVMIGAIIYSLTLICSSFITNINQFIIFYAIFGGTGNAFLYVPLTAVLAGYFKQHFGVATSIYISSFSMGKLLLTPLVDIVLFEYGWRGCMLIMGGVTLNACVGAALFQPPQRHWRLEPSAQPLLEMVDGKPKGINLTNGCTTNRSTSISLRKKLLKALDLSLLKDSRFYLAGSTYCLLFTVAMCSTSFIFPFGIEAGLMPMEAAWFVSVQAIGELFGRISGGIIVKVLKLPVVPSFLVLTIMASFSYVAVTWVSTFLTLYLMIGFCGFVFGGSVGMSQSIIMETMGVGKFVPAMGFSVFFQGFAMLSFGPFCGWLRDFTGTYVTAFYSFAFLLAIVVIMWTLKFLMQFRRR